MKLLVFSDSHKNLAPMLDIVKKEQPDEVFHLGDHLKDAEDLSYAYPKLPVTMVPGNCDGWTRVPDRKLVERAGHKMLLGHGHQWHVKSSLDYAVAEARREGAAALLYGHTHQALCRRMGGLWVLNPGAIGASGDRASYGIITLEQGSIFCQVHPLRGR